jgi:hypothetical protein
MLPAELRDLVPKGVEVTPQSVYSCKLLVAEWCIGTQNSGYLVERIGRAIAP